MFIDTHCHFDFPPFTDELSDALSLLKQAKVDGLIIPSVLAVHFDRVLNLANQHREIYAALGLHPIYFHTESDLDSLTEKLKSKPNKLVAIGEIGLDKYDLTIEWSQQLLFFRAQLKLAKQFDLPVLIHSRRAHDVVFRELSQIDLPCKGVIHGFSGSYEQAMQFVKLGYAIGVGGVISYARANKTRNAIAKLPLTSLVLETDAPDMPLSGQQGKINRPEYISQIFQVLSELRDEPSSKIRDTILTNTLTLFSRINRINL